MELVTGLALGFILGAAFVIVGLMYLCKDDDNKKK